MNNEKIIKWLLPLLVFAMFLPIWSGVASLVEDFPTPSDTYIAAFGGTNSMGDEIEGVLSDPFYVENEDDKGLFWQILNSLQRVFGGFALALIVGVPVGILIGMSKYASYAFDPFIQILKPVSPLAWLPLFLSLKISI
jgi:nitrate/nitrite transport system permease protein